MPKVKVVFYCNLDGSTPILDWLDKLPKKAKAKCFKLLSRLSSLGYELRRPEADYLRSGIYELRIGYSGVNYRILYFFSLESVVVVSHGIVKERVVPPKEIDRAIQHKAKFEKMPQLHTFKEAIDYEN